MSIDLTDYVIAYLNATPAVTTLLSAPVVADLNMSDTTYNYVIVSETHCANYYEPEGRTSRTEEIIITVYTYAGDRASCVTITNTIITTLLSTDLGYCVGPPQILDNSIMGNVECWVGTTNLHYHVQFSQP
jgi:hypothetical protein